MPSRGLRLLVAVDFSRESLRALQAARGLKQRAGGSITVFHVRPHSDVRAAVMEERGDVLKGAEGTVRSAMNDHYRGRLTTILGNRKEEVWKLASGKPGTEIAREARRGYDLVVAGSRGAGAAARLILGSTVQELLHSSPIPVLVLPSR